MLNDWMATAPRTTITKLRKNGGGSSSSSSSMNIMVMNPFRIAVYVALGLVVVCAMALVRMTFHISEVASVQAVAKSLAESAVLNDNVMSRGGSSSRGGGGDAVRNAIILGEQEEEEEDGEQDIYGERGDEEGDDMHYLANVQNGDIGLPPVLPDLPPLPQGAGSLEDRAWDEKNGPYTFMGTVGCSSSSTTTPCLIHFPYHPNITKRSSTTYIQSLHPDSCLLTVKGQKFADQVNENQDRSLVIQPLLLKNQPLATTDFLVLLADGHGNTGHHSAEQVARDLPFRILNSLEQELQQGSASPLLRRRWDFTATSIDAADAKVISILKKDFLDTDVETVKTPGGGTTGVIALRLGPSLYLAQAGDSFAFVVQWKKPSGAAGSALGGRGVLQQLAAAADGTTTKTKTTTTAATIVLEAVRHKPADPLERQRIEAAGGQVMMPPLGIPGGTSRVVIPDPNGGMLAEALAYVVIDLSFT
jgi:Protein phosphatase 2C